MDSLNWSRRFAGQCVAGALVLVILGVVAVVEWIVDP